MSPFSRLRFSRYAEDLAKAVNELSRESYPVSFLPSSRTISHPVLSGNVTESVTVTAAIPEQTSAAVTPLPPVTLTSEASAIQPTEIAKMTTPAKGSFAAELRAMLEEGLAGVEQAKADGRAQVKEALGKLSEAASATKKVSGSMAKTITDQTDTIMSDLGQISNDL